MADTKPTDNHFIVLVPYNGTGATGGNPLVDDLNIWYQVGLIGARAGTIRPREGAAGKGVQVANTVLLHHRLVISGG